MSVQKEWPRLYTLDSKGKIRIFDCLVESISVQSIDGQEIVYRIITSTGLIDGKLVPQPELVKTGKNKGKKNETDPLAQALLQADSLWQGKLDEGYKSLQQLHNKYEEDKEPGHFIARLTDNEYVKTYLEMFPQAAYTNSNWDELPMLAHPIKKVRKLIFPYIAQPKLNGVRCFSKRDKEDNVLLVSRGGAYYHVPHIEAQIQRLHLKIWLGLAIDPKNLIFDGELYKHSVPLQEISGAARKEEDGLFTANNWLEYHIYDVIDVTNVKATQEEREKLRIKIQDLVRGLFNHIVFVESSLVGDNDVIKHLHDSYVSKGYEGLMLRDILSSYKFNERSYGLIKVKEFKDEEFEIVGFAFNENKTIEESFKFVLKNNNGSKDTFEAVPTGTDAMKRKWYNEMLENKHIGKKATIRYFDRSKEGIPTMGHVRHKDTPCLLEHIRPDGE